MNDIVAIPIENYAVLAGVPVKWLVAHPDLTPAYYRPWPKSNRATGCCTNRPKP